MIDASNSSASPTPDDDVTVDEWYLEETDDGLLVVGRADGRHRAVQYDPETGPQPVLVPAAQLGQLEAVHGSRVPTPARERVQELHEQHAERVAAIHGDDTIEEVNADGEC